MKTLILGLAMALTAACSPSGLESVAIGTELVAKGLKAAKEVDEYVKKERPQAAVVIMNRHLKEIDAAIATVKNDPIMSASDKAAVLVELQKYRTGHERDLDKLRAFANMHSDLSVH